MESWEIVVITIEVAIAVIFMFVGLYIILFPRKPKRLTAEDLMLKEDNDVDQFPK